MQFKRIAIVTVLAAIPAFAQDSSAPAANTPTENIIPIRHIPMRLAGVPTKNGTVTSTNWSGYAVTGTKFTKAEGSWVVPTAHCVKTPSTYSAFWVGIDGYSSDTVEQTGTASQCSGTSPQYYAWYEFYPNPSVLISSVPVKPGNVVSASVTFAGGTFKVTITNETTGKTFTKTGTVPAAKRTSAEWIAEAPYDGEILPLTDFATGEFGDDYTDVASTNDASDSAITGPISDFGSAVEKITMEKSGTPESVPAALSTDGSSFKVNWKAE